MINVYRIYLGRSWSSRGADRQLLALFDAVPEFLHTVTQVSSPESGGAAEAERRASVRVAMTHAHVAVLSVEPGDDWAGLEIEISRQAFRWPIPVIAVAAPDAGLPLPACPGADRVVGWNGVELARAVQELAEEAASMRRSETTRLAKQSHLPASSAPVIEPARATPASEPRTLPYVQIAAAYHRLKAVRTGEPPHGGSV